MSEMVAQQIGGVRGIVEASIPVLIFVLVNMAWPYTRKHAHLDIGVSDLQVAIWSAVASAVLLALYRLARRDSVKHAVNGLFGVALAAYFASRTGRAEDFYLPGIWMSYGEGGLFALSVLIRRPVVGYAWAILTGNHSDWREHPRLVRVFAVCTLAFTAAFWTNSTIQLVLYYAEMPNALGTARLLGKSLYVGAVVLTVWWGRKATTDLERQGVL
ncbi:MAG: hypothetical protein JWO79_1485 [Actinomycetia bacterium]|jgi:hypothetical protein|nr:hypothetical protein [Actinomycetes bacterium]MDQ1653981.1 hypothetical protein [Cryptosporangiaceae bacterium]